MVTQTPTLMDLNLPPSTLPRLVIVGSGFGGIQLVKSLRGQPFQVVLLDKNNYHTFLPLLYQVATAGLEPDAIAEPVREIFREEPHFHFRLAEALRIEPSQNRIDTSLGSLSYDFLVLACGSQANFYGNAALSQHVLPMKTIAQALALRSHLLANAERALELPDTDQQLQLLNVVIAGGGPTGVELAGALCELRDIVLAKDYPTLPVSRMQIQLVEANPRLLHTMSEDSSRKAYAYLTQMGVRIHLNKLVCSFDGTSLLLSDDTRHATKTVFWTAGVKGVIIPGLAADSMSPTNRYLVNLFNQVHGYENVFAIGDNALQTLPTFPNGLPGLAPVSIQQGAHMARNLLNYVQKKPLQPFRYQNKGVMAVIGRNRAVVELPSWHIQGFVAWLLWLGVHLVLLVGFRNRATTLLNWAVNYFSYSRASRLITRFPDATVQAVTGVFQPSDLT